MKIVSQFMQRMWSVHILVFSSPTKSNSTDLDLETLKATVEVPAVYQTTSSSAGIEKCAVSLNIALLEELYIFCSHYFSEERCHTSTICNG